MNKAFSVQGRFLCRVVTLLGLVSLGAIPAFAQLEDPIFRALAGYHQTASVEELEQLAGGTDALVSRLLELRQLEKPPFVGIRATKILLGFSSRPDVQEALEADMGDESRLGVARILVTHIDSVPDQGFRRRLAERALLRVRNDPEFGRYAKTTLLGSADGQVSRLAKIFFDESQ